MTRPNISTACTEQKIGKTSMGCWLIRLRLCLPLLMIATLAACANTALLQAEKLREAGQNEEALATLQAAHQEDPNDLQIKSAFVKQRDTTVLHLLSKMQSIQTDPSSGDSPAIESMLKRLEAAVPDDPRVQALREDIQRKHNVQKLLKEAATALASNDWALAEANLRSVLSVDTSNKEAKKLMAQIDEKRTDQTRRQSTLQLVTSKKPVTLEFREASLRTVFEALTRAADVNFVFDKEVRSDAKVTLFLRNTTVEEALQIIINTQQLGMRLLNKNTVLVFPNTSQKQRELLDTVTRSFYLVNADPKQVQNLVRTVAKSRDIFVDDRLNLLVVRDTPDVMRLVERLVASVDLPDPEVMLELEVMEVSSKRLLELGLTLPTRASYGVDAATAVITSATSGLRWSFANPLAVATLRGTADGSNLLANPKIRARNREKAKISLGEKLPVFSSTTNIGTNTSTSINISYVDVGLKLELEPQIQLNDEVIIKVNLDVTNITNRILTKNGDLAYQVGSRVAATSLRLKDGETQVLAGLINDDENKSSTGLPWLHEMPGVGRLFGQTTDTHNKTEVVLLITPRIIRNLSQEPLPTGAMSSGTESQPGAAPFVVSQGQVSNDLGQGNTGGGLGRNMRPARTQQAILPGPRVSGPEVAMQGAVIQVTVYNPDAQALNSALLYDPNVFEESPGKSTGRLPVQVPPNGQSSFALSVNKVAASQVSALHLDASANAWQIQIINPNENSVSVPPPTEADQQ